MNGFYKCNLGLNFWTVRARACIFHMHIPCHNIDLVLCTRITLLPFRGISVSTDTTYFILAFLAFLTFHINHKDIHVCRKQWLYDKYCVLPSRPEIQIRLLGTCTINTIVDWNSWWDDFIVCTSIRCAIEVSDERCTSKFISVFCVSWEMQLMFEETAN